MQKQATEIANLFLEMQEAGKLPGIAASDSLEHASQIFPQRKTYPMSVTLYATKRNDPTLYVYTFTKQKSDARWKLTGAIVRLQSGEREELKLIE